MTDQGNANRIAQMQRRQAAMAALSAGQAAGLSPKDSMLAAGIDPTSGAAVAAVMAAPFQNVDPNNIAAVLAVPAVSVSQAVSLLGGGQTDQQKAVLAAHQGAAASPNATTGIIGQISALPTPVKVVGGVGLAAAAFAAVRAFL